MTEKLDNFGAAVRAACDRRGWKSLRQAKAGTGLDHTLIGRMKGGYVPAAETVIRWADALKEPVDVWLQHAGYISGVDPPVSPPPSADAVRSPLQFTQPEPPDAVLDAIAQAATKDEKIQIAWEYLRRPELKLRFGSHRADRLDVRLDIIRHYEEMTGVRLLPPEVF